MSFIIRTGNLAGTPKLREAEGKVYTYATVMVSDRIKTKDGEWIDGPPTAYNVNVRGDQARRLVATAERDGNVRVLFAGPYRVKQWDSEKGPQIQHDVANADVGLSFAGQDVGLVSEKPKPKPEAETGGAAGDIFEDGE